MALYLKKGMLSVTKSVNVTVDLSKLGKISTNRIAKFLLTGNIQGEGIPAQVAQGILTNHNQPYIKSTTWIVRWHNLPDEALEQIQVVGGAVSLAFPNIENHRGRYHKSEVINSLINPPSTGECYTYTIRNVYDYDVTLYQPYLNHFKTIKLTPSDQIKRIAKGIKARTIQAITIQIHTGE
jgi:hypothetical protein